MRNLWKRSFASVLLLGTAGGAALALAASGDPPVIPMPAVAPVMVEPAPPAVEPPLPQSPSVSLDWAGPPVVKVGQVGEYTLSVRNTCGQALQKVVVQVKAPDGATVQNTTPASKVVDGVHLFEIGTLPCKSVHTIKLNLKQATKGELNCQAWVTFTGTSAMKALVKEPKLAVTIKAPEKVILGEKFTVEYTVENTGDFMADEVRLNLDRIKTSGPLLPALGLKPGESRRLTAEFLATEPANVSYEATAVAAEGLTASAKTTVQVQVPKLEVAVLCPSNLVIGKSAKYTIQVKNCGEVPLTSVNVRVSYPAGFRVVGTQWKPSDGSTKDTLHWNVGLGQLAPGQVSEGWFDGVQMQPGALPLVSTAEGSHGTKAQHTFAGKVAGIPALRMELLDSVDPVEKGGETTYEIRVVNTGSEADENIRIECRLPKNFEFVTASGPTKALKGEASVFVNNGIEKPGQVSLTTITFDPITELAPKAEAVYTIKVKAVSTGDARFKVNLTSKHLTSPVAKEESTRVYGD